MDDSRRARAGDVLQQGVPRTGTRHFGEFDSLRGLAASIIVVDHWRRIYEGHGVVPHFTPLRLLLIGHSCVIVFFVLSGLVLSMPQVAGRPLHYPAFVAKRILRIYPAYLAALLLALGGCWMFHGGTYYGEYFAKTWSRVPDLPSAMDAVRLVGSYNFARYNMSYWTLVQEMRLSLLVPLLCLAVMASELVTVAAAIVALTVLAFYLERSSGLPHDVVQTVAYLPVFLIGMLCARHLGAARRYVSGMPRVAYWAVLGAVLVPMTMWTTATYHAGMAAVAWDVLLAVICAAFILLSLRADGLSRLLLHPTLLFLGKISYSIYLLHGILLWMFAYVFLGRTGPVVWLPAFLGLTLAGAWGLYTLVEVPSIAAGRSLERYLTRRKAARQAATAAALVAEEEEAAALLPVSGTPS